MPLPMDVSVATEDGSSILSLNSGTIIVIAGPNGVGKSALLAELYRLLGEDVATYLPGHRQINFNTNWDAIQSGVEALYKRLFEHTDHFNRHKNSWAEEQFKSELRILQNRENEYNRNNLKLIKSRGVFSPYTDSCNDSPLDVVNEIFSQSNFPICFGLDETGIWVSRRGSEPYSVEEMSDGERAALYICAVFCNRSSGSVLLIDEPEKHLDRTISTIFIEACLRSRNDICVILSTHEPGLLTAQIDRNILHLRDSRIVRPKPERRIYKVCPIKAGDDLIALRADLMGVRDRILFVEGSESSDDISLYSLIYQGVKVVPKGSCSAVCEATRGISRLVDGHWLEPRGIIDGDGRSADEKIKLEKDGIFLLPFPTIENLFFLPECVSCFVEADMLHSGGLPEQERLNNYKNVIIEVFRAEMYKISALRTVWRVERELASRKISYKNVVEGKVATIEINVREIYDNSIREIEDCLTEGAEYVILHMPIKKTNLPAKACIALGADGFPHYKRIVLRQIEIGSLPGRAALAAIKRHLPDIYGSEKLKIIDRV